MDNSILVLIRIVIISYLIGSIPFGFIIGKFLYKKDIRDFGSKNIGATNVFRTLGVFSGVLALLLDALKGFISVYLIPALNGVNLSTPDCTFASSSNGIVLIYVLSGLASIIGHNWTIFLGFKGGKGVATSIGVALALAPKEAGVAFAAFVLLVLITRYVSVGSIIGSILFLISMFVFKEPLPLLIFGGLACVMIIIRHQTNIKRLMNGTENKVWQKK